MILRLWVLIKRGTQYEKRYEGYPYDFAWSPDDAYVAFTENPIQLGYESDIWMFNPISAEFVNRIEDGVQGGWIETEPGSYQRVGNVWKSPFFGLKNPSMQHDSHTQRLHEEKTECAILKFPPIPYYV